jgi:hypothetical protein
MSSKKPDREILADIVQNHNVTDPAVKNEFHATGKRFLKAIVSAMGLDKGSYEIRSNKGGEAVSGEVVLHAEGIYIYLTADMNGKFYYRKVKSRKDYVGETNHFFNFEDIKTETGIIQFVRNCILVMNGKQPERFQS